MRLSANLSFLFGDAGLEARLARAAAAGFPAVEMLFPYEADLRALRRGLDRHLLEMVLINLPPGNWAQGDRGLAAVPGREAEFRDGVEAAIVAARVLGNRLVHCMAGVAPADADRQRIEDTYVGNLAFACGMARSAGLTVTIEPINPVDMHGYVLQTMDEAARIQDRVGAGNLMLQFDAYHAAMIGRDPAVEWQRHRDRVAHVQVAGYPGRHEPDTEPMISFLSTLAAEGYGGAVGCEYRPRGRTEDGLAWARNFGDSLLCDDSRIRSLKR